jgi:DNA-binding NtrC family response regulator
LSYRINVINIELAPLRERVADITPLAQHFAVRTSDEAGKRCEGFSEEALAALHRYRWPGNVRELQNIVERAVLLGRGPRIVLDDLPGQIASGQGIALEPAAGKHLKDALVSPERSIILEVLETHHWNRNQTAEALGINRTTLYKKMKRLGLEEPKHAVSRS